MQAQVLDLLKDLQKEMNTSILLITHNLGVVWEMCDKVMSLTGADKRSLYIDPSDKSKSFANLWRKEQNHSKEYIFSLEGDWIPTAPATTA